MTEKKKIRIIFFVLYFATLYCGLLFIHYATDSYSDLYNSNAEWQLAVGRYSIYILAKLFEFLEISLMKYQQIFMLISILILSLSAEIIYSSFESVIGEANNLFLYLLSCLSLGNVYSTELYLFPEYTLYNSLGVFFVVWAFAFLKKKTLKNMVYSCLALIVSIGFYQANIGIYVVLCLTYSLLYEYEDIKKILKFCIEMCFCAGVASLFDIIVKKILLYMNLTETISRDANITLSTIVSNLKTIIAEQKNIVLMGDNLLPKYSLFIVLLIGVSGLFFCLKKNKKNLRYILAVTVFLAISYLGVYAPHLIAGNVWLSPRTITPFFVFLSSIFILLYANIGDGNIGVKYFTNFIVIFLCAIDFWCVQGIVQNHIATNKIDQDYAYDIYSELTKYENESGYIVDKIATINDTAPSWKNRYVDFHSYNINERAYVNEWSDVTLIQFVSGRNFEKVEMDNNIYNTHFSGKNWDYYCPEEQLYFEGNVMYWCKY